MKTRLLLAVILFPALAQAQLGIDVSPGITRYSGDTSSAEVVPGVRRFSGAIDGTVTDIAPGIRSFTLRPGGWDAEIQQGVQEDLSRREQEWAAWERARAQAHERERRMFDSWGR